MIILSEEQLSDLLKQQRELCGTAVFNYIISADVKAHIAKKVVIGTSEPNWEKLFEK